jgi:hypothetical protein
MAGRSLALPRSTAKKLRQLLPRSRLLLPGPSLHFLNPFYSLQDTLQPLFLDSSHRQPSMLNARPTSQSLVPFTKAYLLSPSRKRSLLSHPIPHLFQWIFLRIHVPSLPLKSFLTASTRALGRAAFLLSLVRIISPCRRLLFSPSISFPVDATESSDLSTVLVTPMSLSP